jgi:hypothetical protein
VLPHLLTAGSGEEPPAEPVADAQRLSQVLDALVEHGWLVPPTERASMPPWVLHAVSGVVAEAVAALPAKPAAASVAGDPAEWVTDPVSLAGRAQPGAGTTLVAAADVLPDRAWLRLDAACRAAGSGFLPVHGEAGALALGPWRHPDVPTSVGYADVRFRRLAASGSPADLAASWAAREGRTDRGLRPLHVPGLQPSPAVLAVGIGYLTAALAGELPLLHTHQVLIAPDLSVSRHPVLPEPGGLASS